jgi:argininosuccinate lyase
VAADLGLGAPGGSSIDSTASRDEAIGFVFALAITAMTLSRWAEQWIIYSSTEFSFIKLDERYTTGSSMMPQKRNPDMLELIRGRSGGVYGNLMALLTLCKGLPLGYNRDLQEDKRHVFAAYDCVMDSLEMAARIVGTTRFRKDKIEGSLGKGFLDATSLAEYLVTRGVAFRSAHQIVGRLVRVCEERGYEGLGAMSIDEMKKECRLMGCKPEVFGSDVRKWLGAGNVVRRYRTKGNAGWSGAEKQLKKWRKRLGV